MITTNKVPHEDFEFIKSTLSQAKTNYIGAYKLWLAYGILSLISTLSGLGGSFLIMSSFDWVGTVLLLLQSIVLPLLLIFLYIKVFWQESKNMNKYYLSCLALWGIPAIAMPIFTGIIRAGISIRLPTGTAVAADTLHKMHEFTEVVNILLLCLCYIICAFITHRKWLISIGLAALFVYLILNALTTTDTLIIEVWRKGETYMTLSASMLFCQAAVVIGYFAAALIVKSANRKLGDCSGGSK